MISDLIIQISIFLALYIQIFLLISIFFGRKNPPQKTALYPSVSIIVPCFNEEKTVAKTIISLLGLNYPKDRLEIIVVDDGSQDNTLKIAREFEKKGVKIVHQKNSGKYTAVNKGISISNSELIGCLDADSEVHPEALESMISYFENDKIAAVIPVMIVKNPKTLIQYIQRVEYNVGVFVKWAHSNINAIHVTPGPFSIFKREVIKKIGGFKHAHNTEDMEIALRIQENGYRIVNCPIAKVYTVTPDTLKKLYKQRVRWAYGYFKNVKDYKHLFFNKKYGNIGFSTLPFSIVSVITGLYLFFLLIYNLIQIMYEKIVTLSLIGFHFSLPTFSWFKINTNVAPLLAIILISTTIFFALAGKKISGQKPTPSVSMIIFLLVYGFIVPLWLGKALYNVALAKKTSWR